jgi:hypothetical protein
MTDRELLKLLQPRIYELAKVCLDMSSQAQSVVMHDYLISVQTMLQNSLLGLASVIAGGDNG